MVIVPAGLIEESKAKVRPYTDLLSSKGKVGGGAELKIPPAPTHFSIREAPSIEVRGCCHQTKDAYVRLFSIPFSGHLGAQHGLWT
jgi:hypothetical protein